MHDTWTLADVDLAPVDEIVTITMCGGNIVIRPTGELDSMRTRVFVDALNAAGSAGSVVMLSVGPESNGTDAADAFPVDELGAWDFDLVPTAVEPVLAGVIRVRVHDMYWTIDVTAGRFFRCDRALDVRFLVESDWTPYTAMWFTPTTITAATTSGSYVIGQRARSDRGALAIA